MTKYYASSLAALAIFTGSVLAQNASDTQENSRAVGRQRAVNNANTANENGAADTAVTREGTEAGRRNSLNRTAQAAGLDQAIATCLSLGNQEEIALAQFAQQRADHPQVKEFAQAMIEAHQKALSQLEQAAPQAAGLKLEANGAQETNAQPGTPGAQGTTPGNDRQHQASAAGGHEDQMAQFALQVKQQCLRLTEEGLGQKKGAQFDKCYMGQQIVAHTQVLAELQVAESHVSDQLKPLIQQSVKVTEEHLAHARTIMEQLEAGSPKQASAQQPAPLR